MSADPEDTTLGGSMTFDARTVYLGLTFPGRPEVEAPAELVSFNYAQIIVVGKGEAGKVYAAISKPLGQLKVKRLELPGNVAPDVLNFWTAADSTGNNLEFAWDSADGSEVKYTLRELRLAAVGAAEKLGSRLVLRNVVFVFGGLSNGGNQADVFSHTVKDAQQAA